MRPLRAEHLRTPEEMAAYLEACMEEADGDAAFTVPLFDGFMRRIMPGDDWKSG